MSSSKAAPSKGARIALSVLGVIAVLVGGVWIGQGANLIPGSSMTGSQFWLVVGVIVAIVGVTLLVVANRSRRS